MEIGFFGPAGTFTHQAAALIYKDAMLTPYATIPALLKATGEGRAHACVAPIENSTEGIVNATVDSMIFDCDLFIQRQVTLPIVNHLLAKPGAGQAFTKIFSHSQPLSQCRRFLLETYPQAELVPWTSSAEAARLVADGENGWAAIGTELAASLYGLGIVRESISDEAGNETKFIVAAKQDTTRLFPGGKTTIAFSVLHKPGELYKILDIFALWNVNMTTIVSRPMRKKKGEYVFLVDLDVGGDVKDVSDALTMVRRKAGFYKSLGCYAPESSVLSANDGRG